MFACLTEEIISKATGCKLADVQENWPLILGALAMRGMDSLASQIGVAATVAVETGSFRPIRERMADHLRQPELAKRQDEYKPWIGRGYVQLTWKKNYQRMESVLGINGLVAHPDLALEPANAAAILAEYWADSKAYQAAEAGDWDRVRRRVNGGTNGLKLFQQYVNNMIALCAEA